MYGCCETNIRRDEGDAVSDLEFWQEDEKWPCPLFGKREVTVWYWRDEDCAEPIGPFETKDEAVKDYENMTGRKVEA